MSRRSVTILVVLAAMTFAAAFYAKERRSRLPVHVPLVSRTAANTGRERKAVNMAVAADVSSPARKRFSQREYDLLWQRYKPNSGLADGPLSADRLDNLATIVKNDTRDKKMWPVFRDVIYGNSAALENRLDTGLSADATIHLDYPYNASVSLLDMAIRGGAAGYHTRAPATQLKCRAAYGGCSGWHASQSRSAATPRGSGRRGRCCPASASERGRYRAGARLTEQ